MSKSRTDAHRMELGKIIKPVYRKEVDEREDMVVTDKGCKYYGNVELMMLFCPECIERDCY